MQNKIKWFSESKYVDLETGLQITSDLIRLKKYTIVKKSKQYLINENNTSGIVSITNECKRTGQLELFK